MKKQWLFCLLVALGCLAADVPLNIHSRGDFQPTYMNGRITGAYGWIFHDAARYNSIHKTYIPGDDCFKLDFKDNAFSIAFTSPLASCYKPMDYCIKFYPRQQLGEFPPAEKYRVKLKVRHDKGKLALDNGIVIPKSTEWQIIDKIVQSPFSCFQISLEPGAVFEFEQAELFPVYSNIGGSIALPDGGKLTRFLIPENATGIQRWAIQLWRGYLWKLTGVALPVEITKDPQPTPGAFVAFPGKEISGTWTLNVNKQGITLSYGNHPDIASSLYDYLRRSLGAAFYSYDTRKLPADGSIKLLPAISFKANPHIRHFHPRESLAVYQGGAPVSTLYAQNDINYYDLPNAKNDHIFNLFIPQDKYFKTHPEYFADEGGGQRKIRNCPYYTMHCLTNPDVQKLVIEGSAQYVKYMDGYERVLIDEGDNPIVCNCPECLRFNDGNSSISNIIFDLKIKIAKRIKEVNPNLVLEHSAYYTRKEPPTREFKDLPDNLVLGYCLDFPCTLHVDCEANKTCMDRLKKYYKLVGNNPEKLSFMTYLDLRPLFMLKQFEALSHIANDTVLMWCWKSYDPATSFVLGRWNMGEDGLTVLKEFEEAYYGPEAGKLIHQVYELVENYAENYQHTPAELQRYATLYWPLGFHILPDISNNTTLMDRPLLDKVNALFEKALTSVQNDPKLKKHVLREWMFYLTEDLNHTKAYSCSTDEEFQAFMKRLKVLVDAAQAYPDLFNEKLTHSLNGRAFFFHVTGVPLPQTVKNWANEPLVKQVLEHPDQYISRSGIPFAGQGTYYSPLFFKQNAQFSMEERPSLKNLPYERHHLVVLPTESISLNFKVSDKPQGPLAICLEGRIGQNDTNLTLELFLNGQRIHKGKAPFSDKEWKRLGISVPAQQLKIGENLLEIKNSSPYTGWFAISEIYTINPSNDFKLFANQAKDTLWQQRLEEEEEGTPGTVTAKDGTVTLSNTKRGITSLFYFNGSHYHPKLVANQKGKVTFSVWASGNGTLKLGMAKYKPYELDKKQCQILDPTGYRRSVGYQGPEYSAPFQVTSTPQKYTYTFKTPDNIGCVFPKIILENEGKITISHIEVSLN